jgi:outer membrane protein OmpA-like peptidoglycan-associated protein
MKKLLLLPCVGALFGCASQTTFVHSDTTLGRVVVYRNGIAYFERTARVEGDSLKLAVPADKVDDFLKSLTVVDAHTGEPAPIAYPTAVPSSETGLIDMDINLPGPMPHELRLSYVTEAPSWKPSYRLVLEKPGKVSIQAWAIVDNTSGEDWKNVELAVGSSSALSFRFDLRSVRVVQRETLEADNLFAQAPPMGGATFAQQGQQGGSRVLVDLGDEALNVDREREQAAAEQKAPPSKKGGGSLHTPVAPKGIAPQAAAPAARGAWGGHATMNDSSGLANQEQGLGNANGSDHRALEGMAKQLNTSSNKVVIQGFADPNDADKNAASLERANRAREQLIRSGVDPNRLVAVGNGQQPGHSGGVRIMEVPPEAIAKPPADAKPDAAGSDPIGTSHFESKSRMSVARGTSAMVSILNTETDGEVVYLYDAESPRGNAAFPFKSVRIKNPTDSVLESGPVTVFGDGKFVGEGLSEPIPAHSTAFIPFALDRQILVERKDAEADAISRIITVQRGVFSTEVQHTRRATLVLHNRTGEKATVYIRHTVADGYKLAKAPVVQERLGSAYIFRADVEPNGKVEVSIDESTPVFKSTDIRTAAGMELVTVYLSSAVVEGPLKGAVDELLKLHREMANVEQQIATLRDEMGEYRTRMDELHAQIVTLKLVKTAGPLMQSLEKKLQEVSDKLSKATIDLVALQEKLMVARIRFQDGVADLSLDKKEEAPKG